jgi:hypothetical protein
MADWPDRDDRAVLTLACCGEQLATRIESIDGDECVVHLPVHACLQANTDADDNVLSWFSSNTCWTRPVAITGFGGYPRAALWMLRANGETQQWQRRDFVRVRTDLPVQALVDNVTVAAFEAVDFSEGGLRCVMSGADFSKLPQLFDLSFELNGIATRVAARVAWSSIDPDDEMAEAVAGFEFQGVRETEADAIRAYVFGLQIALRRKQLVTH